MRNLHLELLNIVVSPNLKNQHAGGVIWVPLILKNEDPGCKFAEFEKIPNHVEEDERPDFHKAHKKEQVEKQSVEDLKKLPLSEFNQACRALENLDKLNSKVTGNDMFTKTHLDSWPL